MHTQQTAAKGGTQKNKTESRVAKKMVEKKEMK
jgi:hypothetical protein